MAEEENELAMTSRESAAPQRVEEEMDEHRILVNKIRKKVYENVLVRFITAKHEFVTSDIVHEETIPDTSLVVNYHSHYTFGIFPLTPPHTHTHTHTP